MGDYLVIATNPAGEDSTVCTLSVLPDKPGVDDRAFVPEDKFRDLNNPDAPGKRPIAINPAADLSPEKLRALKPIPTGSKPGEEVAEPMRPPRVIVPLVDSVLEEQMPVVFTTTIDAGSPMATVSARHRIARWHTPPFCFSSLGSRTGNHWWKALDSLRLIIL